jgi:large subunit ribosomal protein L17
LYPARKIRYFKILWWQSKITSEENSKQLQILKHARYCIGHLIQSAVKFSPAVLSCSENNMMSNFFSVICLVLFIAQVSAFTVTNSRITAPMRGQNLQMISHRMGFNRLSRPADQRKALLRALTTEVIRHGRIRTTLVKAKALRKYVDHMITLAKRGTLHTRRQALSWIYDKDLVASLFEQVPERYADRQGGYCRVIREELPRRGDSAQMAIVELV